MRAKFFVFTLAAIAALGGGYAALSVWGDRGTARAELTNGPFLTLEDFLGGARPEQPVIEQPRCGEAQLWTNELRCYERPLVCPRGGEACKDIATIWKEHSLPDGSIDI